jgi:carbonic anhydrase
MDSDHRLSPRDALGLLREGNRRFVSGMPEHPRQDYQRLKELAREGQQPIAAILACSDSRLPVEIMFDCGFGDLFVIRTAGNTFTPSVLGSVEFAVDYFEVPLVVVVGHSDCGAVGTVVAGQKVSASIEPSLATIREAAKQLSGDPSADMGDTLATANVWLTIERLIQRSVPLQLRLQSGQTGVAAAMCNTATAKVQWLEQPAGRRG